MYLDARIRTQYMYTASGTSYTGTYEGKVVLQIL